MKKYINLWVFSVILLMISAVLIVGIGSGKNFLEFQIAFNMINSIAGIMILRTCYAIYKLPHKTYLDQYCMVIVLFVTLLYILEVPETVLLLPMFFLQFLSICEMLYAIIRKWRGKLSVKLFSMLNLGIYGFLKMYISLTATQENYLVLLFIDLTFLILVNFNFAMLFVVSTQHMNQIREGYIYDIAEKAVDIVFYYSIYPHPEFSFISPSVEETVGYKQKDFYRNSRMHIELTHEEDRETIIRAFSPTSNERTKDFIRWQRKDGEYVYLEYHNNPIEKNGKIVAVEGVLRDVTDNKLAEKEMLEAQKTQQIFLSYISHELKTPITYIMGYTEMLKKNIWKKEEEREEALDLIYAKSGILQKLVEDLFQLSKMEANQFSFRFMQVRAVELYNLLDSAYGRDVVAAGITYESFLDPDIKKHDIEVLADIARIEQVHINILQNAIKYAVNSDRITFECTLDQAKQNVVFKITDTGNGIKNEELERIFEPFYRGNETKKADSKGTGLGLAIAKQIMLAHYGTIKAISKKGQGSQFIFTIPVYH